MPTVRLYNSLTHRLEPFEPLEPGRVLMYNCGPTVYDYAHIGNFRSFLMADLLRRMLEGCGYRVHQVMNITDVGHMTEDSIADGGGRDKMEEGRQRLKEAKKQGQAQVDNPDDPYAVAEYFTGCFLEDARALRLKVAGDAESCRPRATRYVAGMIDMIERLIRRGHAYVGGDGAVYYDVSSFPEYGRLSGNTLDRVQTGAGGRISAADQAHKRHPADFLLWKPDGSHLMRWPSPWGEGYPGWHIECSTMSLSVLGAETIDIHTGGEDNIFPHHECEIAQSSGATGKPFARYWLHARFLMVEGEKMSKSRGNFFTVRQLLERGVDPAVLRYELIRTHYRKNMNFTLAGLEAGEKDIRRLRQFAARHPQAQAGSVELGSHPVESAFAGALCDDLNISGALGELFKWIGATSQPTPEDVAALRRIDGILGVLEEARPATQTASPEDARIDALCRDIDAARARRDFAESDRLRDELIAAGIEVQIAKSGTTWRRKISLQ